MLVSGQWQSVGGLDTGVARVVLFAQEFRESGGMQITRGASAAAITPRMAMGTICELKRTAFAIWSSSHLGNL